MPTKEEPQKPPVKGRVIAQAKIGDENVLVVATSDTTVYSAPHEPVVIIFD
jgi:hypothetical protein